MAMLVNPKELFAASALIDKKFKLLDQSIVRIYKCNKNSRDWDDFNPNLSGILFLLEDTTNNSPFLKLVNTKINKVVFDHELYHGFTLSKLSDWCYCFESENYIYGIVFAIGTNIPLFIESVQNSVNNCFSHSSIKHPNEKEEKKKRGSIFGYIKDKWSRFTGKDETGAPLQEDNNPTQIPHEIQITGPTNFEHKMHIGFDSQKGFTYSNLPKEWQTFFSQSDIPKEILENPENNKKIVKAMEKYERKMERERNRTNMELGLPPTMLEQKEDEINKPTSIPTQQKVIHPPPSVIPSTIPPNSQKSSVPPPPPPRKRGNSNAEPNLPPPPSNLPPPPPSSLPPPPPMSMSTSDQIPPAPSNLPPPPSSLPPPPPPPPPMLSPSSDVSRKHLSLASNYSNDSEDNSVNHSRVSSDGGRSDLLDSIRNLDKTKFLKTVKEEDKKPKVPDISTMSKEQQSDFAEFLKKKFSNVIDDDDEDEDDSSEDWD